MKELILTGSVFAPLIREAAYLDPGSGSILLQLLIAAILGFLVLLRTSWSRIRALFRREPPEAEQENEQEQDESG